MSQKRTDETKATGTPEPRARRVLIGLGSLVAATLLWLPSIRFLFPVDTAAVWNYDRVPEVARELADRQLTLWTDDELLAREIQRMRRSNAEWDFMGRTYLSWGLANLALRDPSMRTTTLQVIDTIIAETLRLEEERGFEFFLMDYAKAVPFEVSPPSSLFVESEIALMMGLRRLVEENEAYRPQMAVRVERMIAAMEQSPVLSAESYPDECWMFDVANALAAIKIVDALDGTDHSAFLTEWVAVARRRLVHDETGLLVSMYDLDGQVGDGPEGSTIWQVAHALQIVDPDFARDQYERARSELGLFVLGFGFGREWPSSWEGTQDIDSGMTMTPLHISPSSSGLALVAASAFGDEQLLSALLRSLDYAAFPVRDETGLRYAASSQLGDAVLLYALTLGPAWAEVERRLASQRP